MPNFSTLDFYKAYTTNVQDFLVAEKEIKRTINRALKENKQNTVKIQTKLYSLLYSTYSESSFMKMILTPYGFEQDYINEILNQRSIQEKWYKVLELGFKKFKSNSKSSEIPNKKQELKKIIREFIIDPSLIRNKVAHGQISVVLNRKNDAINVGLTKQIEDLNVVYVSRLFEVNKSMVSIIEDLIESPDKAHYAYYHQKYQNMQNFINKSSSWDIESKMKTKSMSKNILRK